MVKEFINKLLIFIGVRDRVKDNMKINFIDVLTPKFSIEYYPLTDRYYAKYGLYYLKTHHSGIVQTKDDYLFVYAEFSKNKVDAIKLIEKFKEQQLKHNVETIYLE